MPRFGLIAGNGRFPLLFAEAARAAGVEVIAVAHKGETPPELADCVPDVTWVHVGELGKIIATFQAAGVTEAVMAGGIYKVGALTNIQPDARGMAFISKLPNLNDDVILRGVARELEAEGIMIVESTRFLPALVPAAGTLTRTEPDAAQWKDIRLGVAAAKAIGRWDIGQSVVVKRGTVIAVEGAEGTNATIRRAGELAGAGGVVVKVSKPHQDLRFDVPAVGPDTVTVMNEAGVQVLAVEAGKTLLIERPAFVEQANRYDLAVVAVDPADLADEA